MPTSWNETVQIENYLLGEISKEEKAAFEAQLLFDKKLAEEVYWQKKTYVLVQQYGRRQLKRELESIHNKLFSAPKYHTFQQRIYRLFNKK